MTRTPMPVILLLLSLTVFCFPETKECRDDPEFYRYLSGSIGRESGAEPFVYLMPCDTMFINEGVTVNVHGNTYLAFKEPKNENAIVIKGTMIVNGTPSRKVRISSSIDSKLLNPEDLKQPWWGITVEKSGSLILNNTMIYGAYIPVRANSPNLRIVGSFFYGASEIFIDVADNYELPEDKYVAEFSLNDYLQALAESDSAAAGSALPEKKSVWKTPWPYTGIGFLCAGGAVTMILLNQPEKMIRNQQVGTLSPDL